MLLSSYPGNVDSQRFPMLKTIKNPGHVGWTVACRWPPGRWLTARTSRPRTGTFFRHIFQGLGGLADDTVGRLGFWGACFFVVYPVPTVDGRNCLAIFSWGWYVFSRFFFNPIVYLHVVSKHFTRWCKSSFINHRITVLLGSCQNAGRQEDVVKVKVGLREGSGRVPFIKMNNE